MSISLSINNLFRNIVVNENSCPIRSAYIWNIVTGLTVASSSVIVMTAIIRFYSVEIAGYYATAVAISGLAYAIASFNILNFQATDVTDQYCFSEYVSARAFLFVAMLVFLFVYMRVFAYADLLAAVIVLQSCYRGIDAFCETFTSNYQKLGRLDIGCKLGFLRQIIPDGTLMLLIVLATPLPYAIGAAMAAKIVIILLFNLSIHPLFSKWGFALNKKLLALCRDCLPLFISAFLITYIQAAPKIMIERLHSASMQTYFTAIFMPAMIIHLVTGFIYRPMLTSMANDWNKGKFDKMKKDAGKILLASFIFSILCVMSANAVIPVLEFIFGLDVAPYRISFALIMAAGGLNAMAVFIGLIVIIMRNQKVLFIAYAAAAAFITVALPTLVANDGIFGASKGYLLAMLIQFAIIGISCLVTLKKIRKVYHENPDNNSGL